MHNTILFFDLDGTLVENQFSRKAIGKVLSEIAAVIDQPIEALGREMWLENQRRQEADPDSILTMDWAHIVQWLADQHNVTLSNTVDVLWEKYAHADDVVIHDDAPQVLQNLKAPHRKIVLATKGLSKYQNPVLRVTGLDQLLDDILTPDITGYLKTSPEYFNKYAESDALKIQIGDHYYDDLICAQRNGFKTILRAPIAELAPLDPLERPAKIRDYADQINTYPDDGTDIIPDAVVLSLEEVPRIVANWESAQSE